MYDYILALLFLSLLIGIPSYNAWLAFKVNKSAALFWILSFITFPIGTIIILAILSSKKKKADKNNNVNSDSQT